MKSYRASTTMSDNLSIFFENVAPATVPARSWPKILPIQQLGIGERVGRAKFVDAGQKLGELGKIFGVRGSNGRNH
jgi:hypothetical protein